MTIEFSKTITRYIAGCMIFGLTGLMTVSCGKDDGPGGPPVPPSTEKLGSCKEITSCDSRLVVEFAGCYKRKGYMNLEYTITNTGDDISGLKLWSHPNYTYFNVAGRRYDKDSGLTSVLGSQSGTGDISIPVRSGETIRCSHRFPIGENLPVTGIDAHLMIYNYGTGDWNCAGKYITFMGLECENLD